MAVYLAGIPGGYVADRFIGQYRAVLFGGIIIAAGHFSMAVPGLPFFFLGLGLIVIGTGLLKPNVSTMVGTLYTKDDERRDAGFSMFYMGINLGAFIAPLICGWLGQKWNWHFGFAAAGVGMVFGLIQYVAGRKYLTPVTAAANAASTASAAPPRVPLTRTDWARIGAIGILTLFALLFWAGFEQAGSSLTLFADRATRLEIFGFSYPSSWFQSVEPLFVILFSPVFAWLWIRLARAHREPSSPAKFTLGLFFLSLSFLLVVPAAIAFERAGVRVSPMWLVGLYFLQMVGELCLSPVGLSMVTKLAPAHLVGLMMGVWFFATAMGNYVAGWAAGFLENRTYSDVFQAAFLSVLVATIILAILIRPIRKMMSGVK
jgi:POT family proton-dependent oligopeptide transporter